MEAYEKIMRIGCGTYSKVYEYREIATDKRVAVKRIELGVTTDEPDYLRLLSHENVIPLYARFDCCYETNLVMELMDCDLADYLDQVGSGLPEDLLRSYLFQLLRGLAHCHAQGIVHCDLKPKNLLINREGDLKIADFGLAQPVGPSLRSGQLVTLWYRPPELLLGGEQVEPSIDLWSAGCILGEMETGRPVYNGHTEAGMLELIFSNLGELDYCPTLRGLAGFVTDCPLADSPLLDQLLRCDPAQRVTATQALADPLFDATRALFS